MLDQYVRFVSIHTLVNTRTPSTLAVDTEKIQYECMKYDARIRLRTVHFSWFSAYATRDLGHVENLLTAVTITFLPLNRFKS